MSIALCYHTKFAAPWLFLTLVIYGIDMLLRFLRFRMKSATLIAVDKDMTLVCAVLCISGILKTEYV